MSNQTDEILDRNEADWRKEVSELKVKNEELLNNWKRALADLENLRKRKDKEAAELLEFAKEMILLKLLPSLQSLEQVLAHAPNDEKYKDWLVGLRATIMQLEKIMAEMGLEKIKTANEAFNHELHEAVGNEEGPDGQIVREIQPGFTLNQKVIIPAKVVVGKK